jgi:hypothetical protein
MYNGEWQPTYRLAQVDHLRLHVNVRNAGDEANPAAISGDSGRIDGKETFAIEE